MHKNSAESKSLISLSNIPDLKKISFTAFVVLLGLLSSTDLATATSKKKIVHPSQESVDKTNILESNQKRIEHKAVQTVWESLPETPYILEAETGDISPNIIINKALYDIDEVAIADSGKRIYPVREDLRKMQQILNQQGINVLTPTIDISPWIQDVVQMGRDKETGELVVVVNGDNVNSDILNQIASIFLPSTADIGYASRNNEKQEAIYWAKKYDIKYYEKKTITQGGNMLTGKDSAIVGLNDVVLNYGQFYLKGLFEDYTSEINLLKPSLSDEDLYLGNQVVLNAQKAVKENAQNHKLNLENHRHSEKKAISSLTLEDSFENYRFHKTKIMPIGWDSYSEGQKAEFIRTLSARLKFIKIFIARENNIKPENLTFVYPHKFHADMYMIYMEINGKKIILKNDGVESLKLSQMFKNSVLKYAESAPNYNKLDIDEAFSPERHHPSLIDGIFSSKNKKNLEAAGYTVYDTGGALKATVDTYTNNRLRSTQNPLANLNTNLFNGKFFRKSENEYIFLTSDAVPELKAYFTSIMDQIATQENVQIRVVSLPTNSFLNGGGAFNCISVSTFEDIEKNDKLRRAFLKNPF
jgi:hypothetical protein